MKTYQEEKIYLNNCAIDALENKPNKSIVLKENNNTELFLWDAIIDTKILEVLLNPNGCVEVISSADDIPDNSILTEFSNDEMKKILNICGIKY